MSQSTCSNTVVSNKTVLLSHGSLNTTVSMIDGDLFDKLDEIARRIKKNKKPFGGIQVKKKRKINYNTTFV